MTIGIVGLGLIGGSMAKSIRRGTDNRVLGTDINEETMIMARMSGAIEGDLTDETIPECDLIMMAIPPKAILSWAEEKAPLLKGVLVLDLCGVKREICSRLSVLAQENGFSYLGGHPMAGKEVSGFPNASVDLFWGASMILTPDEHTDIQMLDMLKTLFTKVGFNHITFTTPEEHDRIIAYTSQLAHITSSAYVKSPTAQKQMGFSAGSYKDMTRVAKLDENLWTELFMANVDCLTGELRGLIDHLSEYLEALEAKDTEKLTKLLKEGRLLKATAGGN
jgi:prephenate dehydrogenase